MDMTGIKPVFICTGVGGWYSAGQDRLKRSLIFNGSAADMLFYRDEYPPNSPRHEDNPYAFKVAGCREAIRLGYTIFIHIDCSFWAIKNPDRLFDIIAEHGNFGFRTGYNCAQVCPDNLLAAVGISRDEAEKIPETATGLIGFNYSNPKGKEVFDYWAELCDSGLFINSRIHNSSESADPRYAHGRQDQAAYNMALYKAGVSFLYEDYVAYYNGGNYGMDAGKCIFFIGGL